MRGEQLILFEQPVVSRKLNNHLLNELNNNIYDTILNIINTIDIAIHMLSPN